MGIKRFAATVTLGAAIVFIGTSIASAAVVTNTNWDTIESNNGFSPGSAEGSGGAVVELHTDTVVSIDGDVLGTLDSQVFQDGESDPYHYWFRFESEIDNVSEINTGFDIEGFTRVAGYSFSDANEHDSEDPETTDNILTNDDFDIEEDDNDGTLDWEAQDQDAALLGSHWWDAGESVQFFFQSTHAPAGLDLYNVQNSLAGSGEGYVMAESPAVIPTPTAGMAGVSLLGLLGLSHLIRRRRTA